MLHALISPEGGIDRISANIDPKARTRQGWRWVPVENVPAPDHASRLETVSSEYVVDGDKVVQRWTVARRDPVDQAQAVKREARRRILARYEDWRQANMTARGVELLSISMGRVWSREESDEAGALMAAWAWIKAVRSASDAIEAMAPIPADFEADGYWPE